VELQTHAYTPAAARMPAAQREREPFAARQVVLRHLKQSDEIASVLHLREEIDLSVHAAAGPHFATLEKKETSADSSSGLT
jgi:hypothetical protein